MSIHIHTNYYQDNLQSMNCCDCNKGFIVGEELSKQIEISCPYCKSYSVYINAFSDEDKLEEMDMGCLGIYYKEETMKFTESNIGERTVIKVDSISKCSQCKCETNYLDYCTEGGICSPECYDKFNERLSNWSQGKTDTI